MKSIKNHLSLVIALLSILFSMQIFIIVDRSIDAYKEKLSNNYSVIIISKKRLLDETILDISDLILDFQELTPDNVIKKLNKDIDKKNIELLKSTLPKFYKLNLRHYPSPKEIKKLTHDLLLNKNITKVENYAKVHSTTYRLLLLFKDVVSIFALCVFIVTILLIFKELKIWQFKHFERMSIMSLFGAPAWLRSAVLFRLAVMDAVIATFVTFGIFVYLSTNSWLLSQFNSLNIDVVIFNPINDFSIFLVVSVVLAVILATMVVLGHKEEV